MHAKVAQRVTEKRVSGISNCQHRAIKQSLENRAWHQFGQDVSHKILQTVIH